MEVICGKCNGSGIIYRHETCTVCGGTGKMDYGPCSNCNGNGSDYVQKTCNACHGTGKINVTKKCPMCNGTGRIYHKSGHIEWSTCPKCNGAGWIYVYDILQKGIGK